MAHGVTVTEVATSVLSPVTADSAIPFVVGAAPVNMTKLGTAPVNIPVLCTTYQEAVDAFGFADDFENYPLCEFIDAYFNKFGLSPAVLVNVCDPTNSDHKETVVPSSVDIVSGVAEVEATGIILSSVVVESSDGETTYVEGEDYTLSFNGDGDLLVTRVSTGTIPSNATELQVGYDVLKPSGVDQIDISAGLAKIDEVFPRYGVVPALVLAPGWSQVAEVAVEMAAKAGNINGNFKAFALTDVPTDTVTAYTDVASWKSANGYTSERQAVLWPKVKLDDKQYHLSTQLAGAIGVTDAANGNIPYVSPSNKALKANGAVLEDGTEVYLGPDQAGHLNDQGIVTALNFVGGWRSWGNRTGAYPSITDVKDVFIPIRRMFDWMSNTIILTYWQNVDSPMNKRLIETVTDSINIWINGLVSSGVLLGGRVEFNASENPDTQLIDGKIKFHLYVTPPAPAEEINFILEYDASYLQGLFA